MDTIVNLNREIAFETGNARYNRFEERVAEWQKATAEVAEQFGTIVDAGTPEHNDHATGSPEHPDTEPPTGLGRSRSVRER